MNIQKQQNKTSSKFFYAHFENVVHILMLSSSIFMQYLETNTEVETKPKHREAKTMIKKKYIYTKSDHGPKKQ